MEKLRSPKVCAALVMIAWLGTVVSSWGMEAAGRAAIKGDKSCGPKDLQSVAVQLEMACTLKDVQKIFQGKPANAASVRKAIDRSQASSTKAAMDLLNQNPDRSSCIRRGEVAKIWADFRFIPAYSALTFCLFLFVIALRDEAPIRRRTLLTVGALLVAAMFLGDISENFRLFKVINLAAEAPPSPDLTRSVTEQLDQLRVPSFLKMGALALSAAILATLWRSKTRWLVALTRLLGFTAAALLVYGMARRQSEPVTAGMIAFALFWISCLVHAVAEAIQPEALEGGTRS
jgi:hypothetical protein